MYLEAAQCKLVVSKSSYLSLIHGSERVKQCIDFLSAGNNVLVFGCMGNSKDFGGTGLFYMSALSRLPVVLIHNKKLNRYKYSIKYIKHQHIEEKETPQEYMRRLHKAYSSFDPHVNYTWNNKHIW